MSKILKKIIDKVLGGKNKKQYSGKAAWKTVVKIVDKIKLWGQILKLDLSKRVAESSLEFLEEWV